MTTPSTPSPGRLLAARRRNSPPSPGPTPKKGDRPVFTNERILLVEDDSANRKLAALVLSGAGAQVTAVDSAEAALALLSRGRPDGIVLDLVLPRTGGLAMVQQLKADPETRDIPIVAVTSLNGPEVESIVLTAGCAAYLRKPIDTATFAETVAGHIRGSK